MKKFEGLIEHAKRMHKFGIVVLKEEIENVFML